MCTQGQCYSHIIIDDKNIFFIKEKIITTQFIKNLQ